MFFLSQKKSNHKIKIFIVYVSFYFSVCNNFLTIIKISTIYVFLFQKKVKSSNSHLNYSICYFLMYNNNYITAIN